MELDEAGIQELLKSGEMQAILASEGQRIAANAGPGYTSTVHVHSKRAVANVYPETKEAARDNRENNTLLKAL